jgi:putative NIF3 family GTP cyclohydrolase 1 type 2
MTAAPGAADAVVAAMVAAHPHGGPDFEVHQTTSPGFVGRVGDLGPMSLGELGAIASDTFGSAGTRLSGDPAATAGRVAVVPGSGGSFVRQAATAGADVLVTGDVSHHTVVEALDAGVAVIDVGHAPSERPGIRALADLVARLAGDLGCRVVDLTGFDPTPWR